MKELPVMNEAQLLKWEKRSSAAMRKQSNFDKATIALNALEEIVRQMPDAEALKGR